MADRRRDRWNEIVEDDDVTADAGYGCSCGTRTGTWEDADGTRRFCTRCRPWLVNTVTRGFALEDAVR